MRTLRSYILVVSLLFGSMLLQIESVRAEVYSIPTNTIDIKTISVGEIWDMANTAYVNDNFIEAEGYYHEILRRDQHSSKLYYNLGNVYYKRGELGSSLLYYYKALRLNPSDSDIRHNIEVARGRTTDNIEQMPRLFFVEWSEQIGSMMSCMGWTLFSLVLLALALALLLLYLLTERLRWRKFGFWGVLLFSLLFITTTRFAVVARYEMLHPSEAIVMSRSLPVTSSPNSASTELFILHEGTKVKVLNSHDTWCEIMIDDGKKGWVDSGKIERI